MNLVLSITCLNILMIRKNKWLRGKKKIDTWALYNLLLLLFLLSFISYRQVLRKTSLIFIIPLSYICIYYTLRPCILESPREVFWEMQVVYIYNNDANVTLEGLGVLWLYSSSRMNGKITDDLKYFLFAIIKSMHAYITIII